MRSAWPRWSRRWTGRSRSPPAPSPTPGDCSILSLCPARANWERINRAIREALSEVTLAEMAHTIPTAFLLPGEQLAAVRAVTRRPAAANVTE